MAKAIYKEEQHGCTRDSIEFVRKHLPEVGQVYQARGYWKLEDSVLDAWVALYGVHGTIVVSGLSWGYGGEGPRGLVEVLRQAGFDQGKISKAVNTPWVVNQPGDKWSISRAHEVKARGHLFEPECRCGEDGLFECEVDHDDEPWTCPACGGLAEIIGVLGDLVHGRCRNCGIDSSHNIEEG